MTNTAIDFIIFLICYHLIGFSVSLSQGFGYSFGVLNSFVLNKLWTFESKGTKSKTVKEFIRFALINVVSLSVSIYGINLLVENFSLNVLLSKVLVTLLAQFINYIGYKIWVFKKRA